LILDQFEASQDAMCKANDISLYMTSYWVIPYNRQPAPNNWRAAIGCAVEINRFLMYGFTKQELSGYLDLSQHTTQKTSQTNTWQTGIEKYRIMGRYGNWAWNTLKDNRQTQFPGRVEQKVVP